MHQNIVDTRWLLLIRVKPGICGLDSESSISFKVFEKIRSEYFFTQSPKWMHCSKGKDLSKLHFIGFSFGEWRCIKKVKVQHEFLVWEKAKCSISGRGT